MDQASRAQRTAEERRPRLSHHGVVPAKVRPPRVAALDRDRLDAVMAQASRHRLVLVVAPAGSGKTTLLANFVRSAEIPVAWYRAETWDSRVQDLLSHLESAFSAVLGDIPSGWRSVQDAARALEAWPGSRALLVIDDLHTLADSPAENALERLLNYAPPSLTIVAASRALPRFNLSRMRVSGDLLELGAEDLRFRAWEVERLFREFYGDHVPPDELASLARRTNGWAAGLQLFHLATRNRSAEERRRILATLGSGSRLTREYLTRNVLDHLSRDLRRFLVETSPLGRLTGALCDAFLEAERSQELLEHLERNQIFTFAQEDGSYRYHEVLRSHLEAVLLDELGEAAVRSRYADAAALLESVGALPEALAAYCRADDLDAVHRLLGREGERLVQLSGSWVDVVPPALLLHDPWVMLASARRHRDAGRWEVAVEIYQRAEASFAGADASLTAVRERQALLAWLASLPPAGAGDWSSVVRQTTIREPLGVRAQAGALDEPWRTLALGLASLMVGSVADARRLLTLAAETDGASRSAVAAARLGAAVCSLLSGSRPARGDLDATLLATEELRLEWLGRLVRAVQLAAGGGDPTSGDGARTSTDRCDVWVAAIADLLVGWSRLGDAAPAAEPLERAQRSFRWLGAGVLETWAAAMLALALARDGAPGAREAAIQAESMARATGATGPRMFCYLALAEVEPERAADYRALATAVELESGLAPPKAMVPSPELASGTDAVDGLTDSSTAAPDAPSRSAAACIRCFGGFAITVGDRAIDLGAVKPRARAVLRLLAMQLGSPLHREALQEALWPDVDVETGRRNVHVAVSSLRQALEPGIERGGSTYLVREGNAYRLALPPDSEVDVVTFDRELAVARAARQQGDPERAIAAFRAAIELYRGDLLPEDGPAEWVVPLRERYRAALRDAAQAVAELSLAGGDHASAVDACVAGLRVERFADPLWRLLIEARERAGDTAAANVARTGYARVLAELGVTGAP